VVKASEKALADARDKAKKQQKQEAKTRQETKPDSVVQETAPASTVQETAQVQQAYITEYRWVDESGEKPRILQNRTSIEMGIGAGYGSYKYSYDVVSPNRTVSESGSGGGATGHFRFELKYFECYQDAVMLLDLDSSVGPRVAIAAAFLAKYPFVFDQVPVKVTPILGFDVIILDDIKGGGFAFGGRIDVGISKNAYLRSEYLQVVGTIDSDSISGGMSLKVGGGLDIALGGRKKAFWRTELMYNWLSAYNQKGRGVYEQRVDAKSAIHYVDITTGIGYKWGGGKNVPIKIQVVEVE
jgi:hypothetical protein